MQRLLPIQPLISHIIARMLVVEPSMEVAERVDPSEDNLRTLQCPPFFSDSGLHTQPKGSDLYANSCLLFERTCHIDSFQQRNLQIVEVLFKSRKRKLKFNSNNIRWRPHPKQHFICRNFIKIERNNSKRANITWMIDLPMPSFDTLWYWKMNP